MRIIRSVRQMRRISERLHAQRKRIGFVPTMGALHEGHRSLIQTSAKETDVTIVSIFVNPLQFGPSEDFRRYPRPFARDIRLARAAGAQMIFAPSVEELYPKGFQTHVSIKTLAQRWEGASRPGHFNGVATVVTLLFQAVRPSIAYFGQKDYQQTLIVRQLVQDLHFAIQVRMLPTVRDPDGLALSSRNAYLSVSARRQATILYQALCAALDRIQAGERRAVPVIELMRRLISEAEQARIDYVTIVDPKTLAPQWRLRGRVVILLAVWIGTTRLIDNLLVDVT